MTREAQAIPTLWIDTNVMNEVYTQGDLYRDAHRGAKLVEDRRMKLQGSFWLAMALDEQAATTVSYRHEGLRTIVKLAPPASALAGWTAVVIYLLRPEVFPRWNPRARDDGAELPDDDSDARDELMVRLCDAESLALITRDRGAQRRARRAGVSVSDPESYAAAILPHAVAKDRFSGRLRAAAGKYIAEVPSERVMREK